MTRRKTSCIVGGACPLPVWPTLSRLVSHFGALGCGPLPNKASVGIEPFIQFNDHAES